MSNPYSQFNIRPRLNARLPAVPADTYGSRLNFHGPILGTVRLLPPSAAYDNQRLYNTLPSSVPAVARNVSAEFNTAGQLLGSQNLAYMTNCNSGMTVTPVMQLGVGNQPIGLHQPTNFPGTVGMRMCSSGQANNVLQPFVPGNTAAMFQNHIPVLPPDAASVQHTGTSYNVPAFPVIPSNTVNTLSATVDIPFREVQWIPAALQQTGVPQMPYAVEIKPENCETQQKHFPSGYVPVINSAFTVTGANYITECANAQLAPKVYLDIAMDRNTVHLDANQRTADRPSADNITVAKATKKTGKRKGNCHTRTSGAKVLKLPPVKPCSVSLVRIDSISISRPKSNESVEDVCDDQELDKPELDAGSVPEVPEVLSKQDVLETVIQESTSDDQDIPLPVVQQNISYSESDQLIGSDEDVGEDYPPHDDDNCSMNEDVGTEQPLRYEVTTSESDRLIGSDEDVGEDYPPHDDDNCSMNEDVGTEQPLRYEVTTNSDALLFDMECDGEKDNETLRVLLPTENLTTAGGKNGSTKKTDSNTRKSKQPCKIPTASDSQVVSINIDADNSDDDDDIIIASELPPLATDTFSESRSLRTAASACKEKISATQTLFESIEIQKCVNSLLGVPLQSSCFRFDSHSLEVFRLLSMEKRFVPHNVLSQLMDLVASVDAAAAGRGSSCSEVSSGTFSGIPHGGSRKLLFQCLFCPYCELSARRVMVHVKQRHQMYASFIQCSLLPEPSRRILLHIYCRHCNFIAYDSAAMFIHFATYHKVPGILLGQPKDIEHDPDWAPVIDPESSAREFPFYCCPNCSYIDAEWNRMIQHMLKKHASESVFFGCVVRLMMFGRSSKYTSSFTYKSLTRQEQCKVARRQIYACVSCRFFSFYPTYAFCHYVVNHCSVEMLYVCAASPSCSKRCTSLENVISHIQAVHVAMKRLQFRCTATVFDALTSTELDVVPGELVTADVPVRISYRSSSASVRTGSEMTIEIEDDDDSEDVVVLSPACRDEKSDDVEPESDEEKCTDNDAEIIDLCSKSTAAEQNVTKRYPSELGHSNEERRVSEKIVQLLREEDTESEIVLSSDDETSIAKANDAMCGKTNSVLNSADQSITELVSEQNAEANLEGRVEGETSKVTDCDSLREANKQSLGRTESLSSLTELVSVVVKSAYPDANSDSAATVAVSTAAEQSVTKRYPSEMGHSSQERGVSGIIAQLLREDTEADIVLRNSVSVLNPLSTLTELVSSVGLVNSGCLDANPLADSAATVADFENSQCEANEQDLNGTDSQSVQNPLTTCISETSGTELVSSVVDSALPNVDADPLADSAATVASFENPQCEASEKDLNGADSQSVQNPLTTCISETSGTELVNSVVDSAFPNVDADPLADSTATVASFENPQCEASEKDLNGAESNTLSTCMSGRSCTESVNSDVDSASNDANLVADSAATVADVAYDVSVPCLDDVSSSTESASVQNPLQGTTRTDSINSAEDPIFSSKDATQQTVTATAGTDLANQNSVAAVDESTANSAVRWTDDMSSQEIVCGYTVTEGDVTNPQLTNASTAEQELFTSDQQNSIEVFNEWLGFDDDMFSSSELPKSSSEQLESRGRCMLDLEEELLLLAEQQTPDELQPPDRCSNTEHAVSVCSVALSEESVNDDVVNDDVADDSLIVSIEDPCLAPCQQDTSDDAICSDITESEQLHPSVDSWPQESDAADKSLQGNCVEEILVPSYTSCSSEILSESRDLEVTERVESASEHCTVSNSNDKPVTVNQLRFKALSGFRFPASCSFATKPS